ncbi:phosphohistidine phosphatase SixA [candidate division KSB1 bacterium]|nr:phosphohistidine phosphatase SixA [candidate division KSB1 bacterium]
MEVYLLRHAIAADRGTPGLVDDDRPLTADGIDKMKKAARGIAELAKGFDLVLTSPLIRAQETARIAAEATSSSERIGVAKELLPTATTREMYSLLMTHRALERILLVGHEPNLSRFATHLLGGTSSVIEFRKGSLCRIDLTPSTPRESGVLIYLLPPRALRALGSKGRQPHHS